LQLVYIALLLVRTSPSALDYNVRLSHCRLAGMIENPTAKKRETSACALRRFICLSHCVNDVRMLITAGRPLVEAVDGDPKPCWVAVLGILRGMRVWMRWSRFQSLSESSARCKSAVKVLWTDEFNVVERTGVWTAG